MGGACGTYGIEEKCIRVLVRKAERKRPLVIIMFKSQANTKVCVARWRSGFLRLRIRTSGGVLVNTVMSTKLAKNAEHFLTSWGTISFSRQKLHSESNGQAFKQLAQSGKNMQHCTVLYCSGLTASCKAVCLSVCLSVSLR
jgi:uncharacterized protein YeaO (DUF488 family)